MRENETALWRTALFRWLFYSFTVGWGIAWLVFSFLYEMWNWKWLDFAYSVDSSGNEQLLKPASIILGMFISALIVWRRPCIRFIKKIVEYTNRVADDDSK